MKATAPLAILKDTLKRWWSVVTDPSVWLVPGEYSSFWDLSLIHI